MRFRKRPMVDWFDTKELAATGLKSLLSGWFGDFADRRELQAALDPGTLKYYDLRHRAGADGALWLDYLSDTGDGFDSTYTVAWLASRKQLALSEELELPAAAVLVFGGDQVYPTPEMSEYNDRFRGPFTAAFAPSPPQKSPTPEEQVECFALPGNHDWYDGLTNFLRLFCQGRRFGLLQTQQTRSYFALRLQEKVWLWAPDNQLSGELDKPQKDYFCGLAKDVMQDGDQILFITAQPSWVERERDALSPSHTTLSWFLYDFVYNGRQRTGKKFQVQLFMTGDLHHYSRYGSVEDGVLLLTAGGAGAFTHSTHALPAQVRHITQEARQANNVSMQPARLDLAKAYPSKPESFKLLKQNLWWFVLNGNPFSFLLGKRSLSSFLAIVFLAHLLLCLSWPEGSWLQVHLGGVRPCSLAFVWLTVTGWQIFGAGRWSAWLHGFFQSALALACTEVIVRVTLAPLGTFPASWLDAFTGRLLIANLIVLAYAYSAAGTIGLYLYLVATTSGTSGAHETDSSSSLANQDFKNFLRLKVEADQVTIYPVGIPKACHNWEDVSLNPDLPIYAPEKSPPKAILIEGPHVLKFSTSAFEEDTQDLLVGGIDDLS